MKRIANHVAVQTLLYTVRGYQDIEIIDYDNMYNLSENIDGSVVYRGKEVDFVSYKYSRYERAEVLWTCAIGNVLQIRICTSLDKF